METPPLTLEYLESLIIGEKYVHEDNRVTVCLLHIKPDFYIVGQSGVLDRKRFDASIGEKFARENAINQMWQIVGYNRLAIQHEVSSGYLRFAD